MTRVDAVARPATPGQGKGLLRVARLCVFVQGVCMSLHSAAMINATSASNHQAPHLVHDDVREEARRDARREELGGLRACVIVIQSSDVHSHRQQCIAFKPRTVTHVAMTARFFMTVLGCGSWK